MQDIQDVQIFKSATYYKHRQVCEQVITHKYTVITEEILLSHSMIRVINRYVLTPLCFSILSRCPRQLHMLPIPRTAKVYQRQYNSYIQQFTVKAARNSRAFLTQKCILYFFIFKFSFLLTISPGWSSRLTTARQHLR